MAQFWDILWTSESVLRPFTLQDHSFDQLLTQLTKIHPVSLKSSLKPHQCSRELLKHSPATRHGSATWKAMKVFKPSLQGMVLMSCCVATQQPCPSLSIFNITKCSSAQILGFQLTAMQYRLPGNSVRQQRATELSLNKCKINKYYTWQDF